MFSLDSILKLFKLESTYQQENQLDMHVPAYAPNFYHQNSSLSITSKNGYDLTRFSSHEVNTIKYVWDTVLKKYPTEYQSIGLANESYCILYKPRYILFEILIILFSQSENPIDMFAISLAYASKGYYFTQQALDYFEKSEKYITSDFLKDFISYLPLHVYTMFSTLYEQEHLYERAIYFTKLAKRFGEPSNPFFDDRIRSLKEHALHDFPKPNRRMSNRQKQFEENVTKAATYFIINKNLPTEMNTTAHTFKAHPKVKPPLSPTQLNEYAIMCNAALDHEDEMRQYDNE